MSLYTLDVDLSATEDLPRAGTLREAAEAMRTTFRTFAGNVETAHATWAGLPAVYEGPGETAFAAAMDQPQLDAEEVSDSAGAVKSAAAILADAIDALEARRTTLAGTTLPAEQAQLDRAVDPAAPEVNLLLWSAAQGRLRRLAEAIADDWDTAQEDFNTAIRAIARTSAPATANFAYGTNATPVTLAGRLFAAATGPDATGDDLSAYYAHLASMGPEQLEAFAATHPEARTMPPPVPGTPEALATFPGGTEGAKWWNSLSPAQQVALAAGLPALVGNTQGVPYGTRAAANADALALVRNDPDYTDAQRAAFENIHEALLAPGPDGGERFLVSIAPQDRPLAAISIGNLDTAGNVTWAVSGMGSGTHNMTGEMDKAQGLYNGLGPDSAVVAWLGYDSPDLPQEHETLGRLEVLNVAQADTGGTALAHALDGFQETRAAAGDAPASYQTNVAAHSYGTTTAAYALVRTEHEVDAFIMYGSAGIDPHAADHASDFNVADGGVYATLAHDDPYAPIGQMGSYFGDQPRISPTDDTFGANVFSSDGEGNVPGHSGTGHDQVAGTAYDDGWGYIEPGSQSYNSIVAIIGGDGGGIELIEQSRRDTDNERLAHLLATPDRLYHQLQQDIDAGQEQRNAAYDAFQSAVADQVDSRQDAVNAGIDAAQDRAGRTVDTRQSAGNSGVDALQDTATGWLPGPVRSLVDARVDAGQGAVNTLLDGAQVLGGGMVDAGQGGVDFLVDGIQDATGITADLFQGIGNGTTDALQDGADSVHDGLGDLGRDATDKVRDFVRFMSR